MCRCIDEDVPGVDETSITQGTLHRRKPLELHNQDSHEAADQCCVKFGLCQFLPTRKKRHPFGWRFSLRVEQGTQIHTLGSCSGRNAGCVLFNFPASKMSGHSDRNFRAEMVK